MWISAASSCDVPNTGVLCDSSRFMGGYCREVSCRPRPLISVLRACMASGWVSRKPRSQKAAGPLLHWKEKGIWCDTNYKIWVSSVKNCAEVHIHTIHNTYNTEVVLSACWYDWCEEKPVNHVVETAVSLVWESHLSRADSNCYGLRELLFLPLHISGQLSIDSEGKRTRAAKSISQCLSLPFLLFRLKDLFKGAICHLWKKKKKIETSRMSAC